MPPQDRIIIRMPAVLDTPRRLHPARYTSHSSPSILPALPVGRQLLPPVQQGPQRLALGLLALQNGLQRDRLQDIGPLTSAAS